MKPPITSQARALAEIRSLSIRLEDSFPEAAQVLRTAAGAVGDGHVGQLAELARRTASAGYSRSSRGRSPRRRC